MTVGVMQPYFFPYLGYYQLAYHCDTFVFYDDVNYIKRGYINRNNIITAGQKHLISLPVMKASQNKKINELRFQSDLAKTYKTIVHSYSKAPYFKKVLPLISRVFDSEERTVSIFTAKTITSVFNYLGIERRFIFSSELDYDRHQEAAEKLRSICRSLDSKKYCNSLGGRELYSKDDFSTNGIELSFLHPIIEPYFQNQREFISGLSMIDVLMWNSPEEIKSMLRNYKLV